MLTAIDHIIIAVPDLPAAIRDYTELGFNVVEGGRHPVGTYNALIALADGSYIELISFYEPNPDHRWWEPLQKGGGLVDFCCQTDDLMADTAAFRSAGVDIADPVPQSRRRLDGYELHWVFSLARGPHRGVAPFIIEDVTPIEERIPSETTHANGVTGIASIAVAVDDLPTVRGWYSKILGQEGREIASHDLGAEGVAFSIGPHTVDIVRPASSDRGSAGSGQIEEWLERRGPSPFSATLRCEKQGGRLGPSKTHNAQLFVV